MVLRWDGVAVITSIQNFNNCNQITYNNYSSNSNQTAKQNRLSLARGRCHPPDGFEQEPMREGDAGKH